MSQSLEPWSKTVANKTSSKSRKIASSSTKSTKKPGSRATKVYAAKFGDGVVKSPASADEISIDRRRADRRGGDEAGEPATTGAGPQLERRKKVNRRRQIDPTTCERDYTDQEVEFMNALDEYKRKSGRMFPTCSEVLEVLRGLGYMKLSAAELCAIPAESAPATSAKPMPITLQETAVPID